MILETKKDFEVTKDDISLSAQMQIIGLDVLVVGGTNPHIGSVTTLTKDESQKPHDFPSHDGRRHQDGQLSARIAKEIKPVLKGSATITSGVHYNNISWDSILTSLELSVELGKQIREYLETVDFSKVEQPIYQKLEH